MKAPCKTEKYSLHVGEDYMTIETSSGVTFTANYPDSSDVKAAKVMIKKLNS